MSNPFHEHAQQMLIDRKVFGGQHSSSSTITDPRELALLRAFGPVDDLVRLADFEQARIDATNNRDIQF